MNQSLLPVIRLSERQIIRAAADALRDIYARGFVDYKFDEADGADVLAAHLDAFLVTYDKTVEVPLHRLVGD
jgi:hypothetical protein